MSKNFLIELPHEAEGAACACFVKIVLGYGSHFLARAHWGCRDGVHSAWVIIDAASREEARSVVPPQFRASARIVELNAFTLADVGGAGAG